MVLHRDVINAHLFNTALAVLLTYSVHRALAPQRHHSSALSFRLRGPRPIPAIRSELYPSIIMSTTPPPGSSGAGTAAAVHSSLPQAASMEPSVHLVETRLGHKKVFCPNPLRVKKPRLLEPWFTIWPTPRSPAKANLCPTVFGCKFCQRSYN